MCYSGHLKTGFLDMLKGFVLFFLHPYNAFVVSGK